MRLKSKRSLFMSMSSNALVKILDNFRSGKWARRHTWRPKARSFKSSIVVRSSRHGKGKVAYRPTILIWD